MHGKKREEFGECGAERNAPRTPSRSVGGPTAGVETRRASGIADGKTPQASRTESHVKT